MIYQANNYSKWLSAAGLAPLSSELLCDREQLRECGLLQVLTPDAAVKMIRTFATTVPSTHFYSWTLPPGLSPRWAQAHLELFASEVISGVSVTARYRPSRIRDERPRLQAASW
jgi:hypothetical protein